MPFAGVFALGGALRLLEEIGLHNIEARVHELTEDLHVRMVDLGVTVLSPRDRERRSGITVLEVSEPKRVATRLQERNILTAARRNGLRVALHFYNDHDDIERFTIAMTDILNED
jgi:selenocysteine lyase/cysteine desulfurase